VRIKGRGPSSAFAQSAHQVVTSGIKSDKQARVLFATRGSKPSELSLTVWEKGPANGNHEMVQFGRYSSMPKPCSCIWSQGSLRQSLSFETDGDCAVSVGLHRPYTYTLEVWIPQPVAPLPIKNSHHSCQKHGTLDSNQLICLDFGLRSLAQGGQVARVKVFMGLDSNKSLKIRFVRK
jgi:hypothetical protein